MFDLVAMSRVVAFVQSPIAKTFLGVYIGVTDLDQLKRSDLRWPESPSLLLRLSVGGEHAYAALRKGCNEFDRYFRYNEEDGECKEYTLHDMENAIEMLSDPERNVTQFYTALVKKNVKSFVSEHKLWITGGTGFLSLLILVYIYLFRGSNPAEKNANNKRCLDQ